MCIAKGAQGEDRIYDGNEGITWATYIFTTRRIPAWNRRTRVARYYRVNEILRDEVKVDVTSIGTMKKHRRSSRISLSSLLNYQAAAMRK